MIISFVSQKGGSGKTTICVNFAALAAINSIPAAIIDLDPQASASAWSAMREKKIETEACHPPLLAKTIEKLRNKSHKIIFIDTPPHNSTAAANAIRMSDFVVVPVRPSSFDLVAVTDTIELLRSVTKNAAFVVNAVPPNTTVADSAEDLLKESSLECLGRVGHRINIQHALTRGKGISETEPKSLSSQEIINIWNAVTQRIRL